MSSKPEKIMSKPFGDETDPRGFWLLLVEHIEHLKVRNYSIHTQRIRAIYASVTGKKTSEVRYYISSRAAKVGEFASPVRKHCGTERTHWILDIVFGEEASRIRTGTRPRT